MTYEPRPLDSNLATMVRRVAEHEPWLPALIAGAEEISYGELDARVSRVAGYLRANGIGPGEIVTWHAPNWWETCVLALAIWQAGAVSNPVVPFYRENEIRQILDQIEPAMVVTTGEYRGFDAAAAFDRAFAERGMEPIKVQLRGDSDAWQPFETLLEGSPIDPVAVDGGADCLILFTSGTTSAPKGAVHTYDGLMSEISQVTREWGMGWQDRSYMAAPLPHVTGIVLGFGAPWSVGACLVLAERWDPEAAAATMVEHDVSFATGPTIFLQELTAAVERAELRDRLSIRIFCCGGAPVPESVMRRAEEAGIPAFRCYGMTECPTVTLANTGVPFDRRANTDGLIAEGVEVISIDEAGAPLSPEEDGELLVRGPERMVRYLDPERTAEAIDAEGWFHTGDIGHVTADGFVLITGRIKDIINRGGEKFSTREIEDHLVSHPSVRHAAVVPAPHERLGEVPAAFLVLEQGAGLDPALLTGHLEGLGLPKQKLPTAWHEVESLPTTPSGKVRKVDLIARL